MSRAGYRAPVVEYCGGTEIGGGYITGTVVQPASPATFSTPALGLDVVILDEGGRQAREGADGEVFLVPPSIGLSQSLLNRDHHEVYHAGCPAGPGGELLRRHGDQMERLAGGYFRAHGRADDTMNLGGIKVVGELEAVLGVPDVTDVAAIAVICRAAAVTFVLYVVSRPDASIKLNPARRREGDAEHLVRCSRARRAARRHAPAHRVQQGDAPRAALAVQRVALLQQHDLPGARAIPRPHPIDKVRPTNPVACRADRVAVWPPGSAPRRQVATSRPPAS
jgi:acyl-coenzyme A synthetase/AMP-(fatty) acid ligase